MILLASTMDGLDLSRSRVMVAAVQIWRSTAFRS